MPKCKACGTQCSLWSIRFDGLCQQCATHRGEQVKASTFPPDTIGTHIILVLENVIAFKPMWAHAGDLFITDTALIFVNYRAFQSAGRVGGAAAAAVGGLAGGIAFSISEKTRASSALEHAVNDR